MKILLINNEFPPIGGGGSVLNYEIALKLLKKKHQVSLITSSYRDLPKKETIQKLRVIRVPALRKSPSYSTPLELISFFISSLIYCLFYVPRFKPDVIQAFFAVPSGGVAYIINMIYGVPYCIYLGGSDVPWGNKVRFKKLYPFLTPFIKLFWRKAKYIIAPSNGLIELTKNSDPLIKEKLVKIPNGVDLKKYKKSVQKDKDTITIMAVGRIIYRKGFQDLIKAISIIKDEVISKKIKCIIIGNGDYEVKLKELAKKLDLRENIQFIDSVNYETLVNYYLRSDIFVLPSYSEGMSLALIEAMAAKNAIIATDVAGTDEIIKQGRNGFLIKVNKPKMIADNLKKLILDRKLLRLMQKRAYDTAKKYDWSHIATGYNKIYNKIVK